MKRPNRAASAALVSFLIALSLTSCSYFAASPSGGGPVVTRVASTGSFDYTVDSGGDEKDVIFVFSAETGARSMFPTLSRLRVDGVELPTPSAPALPAAFGSSATAAQRIADFNRTALSKYGVKGAPRASTFAGGPGSPRAVAVNDPGSFSIDDYVTTAAAHCRAVVGPVTVSADSTPRTLAIWVSDSEWGAGLHPINQAMVDALASRFLKAGSDNDIYDWLTNILGAEWGETSYSNLIPHTGQIDILLTDIEDDDEPTGGIVGFFYALNNFVASGTYSDSNERIMFVIDSVMFQNDDNLDGTAGDGWDADDEWPLEIYSTLAHEFQHMIHFYQKALVAGAGDTADVWIDEMCAQLAEDLLADKMGVPGPRGVSPADATSGSPGNRNGRIPIYNGNFYLPLVTTSGFDVFDYSTVYAFGAWAARNFGGTEFLRRIVQSSYTDQEAVERAAADGGASPSDLNSLVSQWAVAVMGSDRTDMPKGYRFNRNDWFASTAGSTQYNLGSIDFGNYTPRLFDGTYGSEDGIYYFTSSYKSSMMYASSNVYYLAKEGLSGKKTFSVDLPDGVIMHVVVK